MNERALYSEPAQKACVASALLDNAMMRGVLSPLGPGHFTGNYKTIFRLMLNLSEEGLPFNICLLADKLSANDGSYQHWAAILSDLVDGAVADEAIIAQHVATLEEDVADARYRAHVGVLVQEVERGTNRLDLLEKMSRFVEAEKAEGSVRPKANSLEVIRGDEAEETVLEWLWKPYLPLGKLVHGAGDSSAGKSPITIDLAARLSVGAPWPDGTPNKCGPRSTILLNGEDDLKDTILPRFRVAGGDTSRLYYVKGTRVIGGTTASLALDRDMDALQSCARTIRDVGMIIIDPITNYLGNKKFIDEGDVRSVLMPLAGLASELGCVVITMGHLNRREKGTHPLHRILGAGAFSGVARAVYLFGPDPDKESKYAHVMSVVRSCGGDGAALRYETQLLTESNANGLTAEIVKVSWTGKSEARAEEIADGTSVMDKGQEQEAADMLRNLLRDGHLPAKECMSVLEAEGFDCKKLNLGRIRRKAGADSRKWPGERFNRWFLVDTQGFGLTAHENVCARVNLSTC